MTDLERLLAVVAVGVLLLVTVLLLSINGWHEGSTGNAWLPLICLTSGYLLGRSAPSRAQRPKEPTS